MSPKRALSSRLSWITAVAVVAVAAVLTGTMLASAAPTLPRRTPSQLLADMQHAKAPSAFSGVITENANLGFPALPNVGGLNSSTLSALKHTVGGHWTLWSTRRKPKSVLVPTDRTSSERPLCAVVKGERSRCPGFILAISTRSRLAPS